MSERTASRELHVPNIPSYDLMGGPQCAAEIREIPKTSEATWGQASILLPDSGEMNKGQ